MLKVFNISNNGFSNDGVVAIAKALEVNSSILELDISYVYLYPSVCICLLAQPKSIMYNMYAYTHMNLSLYKSLHFSSYAHICYVSLQYIRTYIIHDCMYTVTLFN